MLPPGADEALAAWADVTAAKMDGSPAVTELATTLTELPAAQRRLPWPRYPAPGEARADEAARRAVRSGKRCVI